MELSKKPRILIFIDWFLPGYKAGGPIQSCANLIAHLKDEFDFWVITRDTDYCEREPYEQVESDSWNRIEEHLQVYYTSGKSLSYKALMSAARAAEPDIVFINGVYSFYFSILPILIAKKLACPKIIVSTRGMLAEGSINVKAGKKKFFIWAARRVGLYKHVLFHATNSKEKEDVITQIGNDCNIMIAPNLPKAMAGLHVIDRKKEVGILKIVSVARISPEKNTLYALEILRKYRGQSQVTFDIYGPIYNKAYWNECESLISKMPASVKVNYCGSIPNNLVFDKLLQYHLMFLPTQGENFGHIILESLTAGCPVLISDKTPWLNLSQIGVGYDFPLSDQEAFVDIIEKFSALDTKQFNNYSLRAVEFAKKHLNNEAAIEANMSLFNS
ncbi:glycosyltransferase family 4 protein [uncultured Pontibacter sp.]|uniref:glycosyltransferase family 4 protein n=1 Tax=uncultured Pontibacter sp. TaxID=453356 RepID=UPI00262DFCB6|nr:glycosyltransferase family 4 protein [uncultured Pontibacter sp.]